MATGLTTLAEEEGSVIVIAIMDLLCETDVEEGGDKRFVMVAGDTDRLRRPVVAVAMLVIEEEEEGTIDGDKEDDDDALEG